MAKKLSNNQKGFDGAAKELIRHGNSTGMEIPSWSPQLNHEFNVGQRLLADHVKLNGTTSSQRNSLTGDIFWSIYRSGNRQSLKSKPPLNREFNRAVIEKLTFNHAWRKSVMQLTGNRISSRVAAEKIVEELLEDEDFQDAMEKMEKADDCDSRADKKEKQDGDGDGDEQEEQEGEQEGDGDEADGDDQEDGEGEYESAEDLRTLAQQLRDEVAGAMEKKMAGFGAQMELGNAIREGKEDGEAVAAFLSSLGINEGAGSTLSAEDIEKILAIFDKGGLQALANLIGRSYGAATEVLRGRAPVETYIDEAGYTRRFSDVFTHEQALMSELVPEKVRLDQITEYVRHGLSGMQQTGQADWGGVKVFAIDSSKSMESALNRDDRDGKAYNDPTKTYVLRTEAAAGLTLGLCRAAEETGQKWNAFKFSGRGQVSESITDKDPIGRIMDWLAFQFDGDTDFGTTLIHAMELIELMTEEDKFQADIVVLTDGGSRISAYVIQKYSEFKEKYGTRMYVLTIGEGSNGTIERLADFLFKFTSIEQASDTLAQLMFIAPRKEEHE